MGQHLGSEIPKEWQDEINRLPKEEVATDLSLHRTEMSTHRTQMSTARSHMSNERTHLSYLRTSLSLMTFGTTLNRFSVFLQENKKALPKGHYVLLQTEYAGLGFVLIGIAILAWGLHRYTMVDKEIETDTFTSSHLAMKILTWTVLVLASFSTLWMTLQRD